MDHNCHPFQLLHPPSHPHPLHPPSDCLIHYFIIHRLGFQGTYCIRILISDQMAIPMTPFCFHLVCLHIRQPCLCKALSQSFAKKCLFLCICSNSMDNGIFSCERTRLKLKPPGCLPLIIYDRSAHFLLE